MNIFFMGANSTKFKYPLKYCFTTIRKTYQMSSESFKHENAIPKKTIFFELNFPFPINTVVFNYKIIINMKYAL